MRAIPITVLLLLALVFEDADACKPRFWSTKEIVQSSSAIFIGKITAKRSDLGKEMLTLRVQETLKGSLPPSIRTDAHNVRAFADGCHALEGYPPVRSVGETWVISGHFYKETQSFQPIGETSFRLPDSYQAQEPDQLRALREELGKAAPNNAAAAGGPILFTAEQ